MKPPTVRKKRSQRKPGKKPKSSKSLRQAGSVVSSDLKRSKRTYEILTGRLPRLPDGHRPTDRDVDAWVESIGVITREYWLWAVGQQPTSRLARQFVAFVLVHVKAIARFESTTMWDEIPERLMEARRTAIPSGWELADRKLKVPTHLETPYSGPSDAALPASGFVLPAFGQTRKTGSHKSQA